MKGRTFTQPMPSTARTSRMPKKRFRTTRSVDTRKHRQRTPPPTIGWFKPELAAMVGISPGTITKYVVAGVLPRATFRGRATRYQREHLVRLLAIRELRARGVVALTRVKAALDELNGEEMEALALARLPSPTVLGALGMTTAVESRGAAANPSEQRPSLPNSFAWGEAAAPRSSAPPSGGDPSPQSATWCEVWLAPGVLLRWNVTAREPSCQLVRELLATHERFTNVTMAAAIG